MGVTFSCGRLVFLVRLMKIDISSTRSMPLAEPVFLAADERDPEEVEAPAPDTPPKSALGTSTLGLDLTRGNRHDSNFDCCRTQ